MSKRSLVVGMVVGFGVVVLGLGAPGVHAGWKMPTTALPVKINRSYLYLEGHLSSVRATADATQYLYCTTQAIASSTKGAPAMQSGSCFAQDSTGLQAACVTNDPALIATIQNLPSDGYIRAYLTPAIGSGTALTNTVCNRIDVYTASYYPPKAP